MYLGFHDAPWTYAIYFIALAALALHAWHGVWSALQTLGAIRGSVIPGVRLIATLVALALFVAVYGRAYRHSVWLGRRACCWFVDCTARRSRWTLREREDK